jgi:hypothetical protein
MLHKLSYTVIEHSIQVGAVDCTARAMSQACIQHDTHRVKRSCSEMQHTSTLHVVKWS